MPAYDAAQRYFDAWNRHDSAAIIDRFMTSGTCSDPAAGELNGPAIGAYAESLFAAFPDLTFELVSVTLADDGRVIAEWLMRGTNRGPFAGAPPTGRVVALPGADFITIDGDRIQSV